MFVGSQIHIGQHWFPSLVDPAKASLCQQPVCAIHMHKYVWCHAKAIQSLVHLPWALQACSCNVLAKCCCPVLSQYCLTYLPFWLVSHDCTHQTVRIRQYTCPSHMCSVHWPVQTQCTAYRILQQGSPDAMQLSTTMTHGIRLAQKGQLASCGEKLCSRPEN